MPDSDARSLLLDAAIDYVADHGLADLSLRRLGAELGSSHRMLIHHFGSKEGLWAAIVKEAERRQLATFESFEHGAVMSLPELLRTWWRRLSDPSLWPSERLFFEVYAHALHNRTGTSEFLDDIVESWLRPSIGIAESMGVPPEVAASYARLGLAVTRGLLLDLLATQDRVAVDAAMEQWIAMSVRLIDQ